MNFEHDKEIVILKEIGPQNIERFLIFFLHYVSFISLGDPAFVPSSQDVKQTEKF